LLYRCAVLYVPAIIGLPFFLWFFIMGVLRIRKFK
jgi:hypothetical protein